MKTKTYHLIIALMTIFSFSSSAQTTAMDFNRKDCDGNMQNLFSDLNSGKAVILEYFMLSCAPCPAAGTVLEAMKANLLSQYPGQIKFYMIAYTNSYSCAQTKNFVTSNGFSAIPMDSGAVQVAYYGGMGMPTIVIAGGATHQLLGSPYQGFTPSDTTTMAADIRTFLNSQVGIKENVNKISDLSVFPNPSSSELNVKLVLKETSSIVIDVLDITGRTVANLFSDKVPAGNFSKTFNTQTLPAGNYMLKIMANGSVTNQKLSIVH